MEQGEIRDLWVGNMFSSKTGLLIQRIHTLQKRQGQRVIIFKPDVDTRSGSCIEARWDGDEDVRLRLPAIDIPTKDPWQLSVILADEERKKGWNKADVLAFDEVQFFSQSSGFHETILYHLSRGYSILLAGLAYDFKGYPFGCTLGFTGLAKENCHWLSVPCAVCKRSADFPQRLINGDPAPFDSPLIEVGDGEKYEPRCAAHHVVPGRPWPPEFVLAKSIQGAGH